MLPSLGGIPWQGTGTGASTNDFGSKPSANGAEVLLFGSRPNQDGGIRLNLNATCCGSAALILLRW